MGLFHPLKEQYAGLQTAMRGRKFITFTQAAAAMGITAGGVPKAIRKMEDKGLLVTGILYRDEELELVVSEEKYAEYAACMYLTDRIQHRIISARKHTEEYTARVNRSIAAEKAKDVGRALSNIAQGFLEGKKFSTVLRKSGDILARKVDGDENGQCDIADILNRLYEYTAKLQDNIEARPDNDYEPALQAFLTALDDALTEWNRYIGKISEYDDAWNTVRKAARGLEEYFVPKYPEILDLSLKTAAANNPDDISEGLRECILYLAGAERQIADARVKASVGRIRGNLEELLSMAGGTGNTMNYTDERALKNTLMPMLKSLLEKYIRYEKNALAKGLSAEAYNPDELLHLLEDEMPRALEKIRSGLRQNAAWEMEDEVSALRKKLEMDGLI
ncbi:MAG: hypothetical protein MJ142_06065 [Clostridia bacterium]|nr:hypothetical protein [Clostridia bacterium]